MSDVVRLAMRVAATDLALELRRPVVWSGMLLLGVSSIVTMHLALAGSGRPTAAVGAGALWVILVFGALLGVGRSVAGDADAGTWDAYLLARGARSGLFFGKVGGTTALIVILHGVLVPLYWAVFAAPEGPRGALLTAVAIVLADIGFATTGVLASAIGMRARSRELLVSGMFLPLSLPPVIAGVTLSLGAHGVDVTAASGAVLGFLVLYDLTFLALGWGVFGELAVE